LGLCILPALSVRIVRPVSSRLWGCIIVTIHRSNLTALAVGRSRSVLPGGHRIGSTDHVKVPGRSALNLPFYYKQGTFFRENQPFSEKYFSVVKNSDTFELTLRESTRRFSQFFGNSNWGIAYFPHYFLICRTMRLVTGSALWGCIIVTIHRST